MHRLLKVNKGKWIPEPIVPVQRPPIKILKSNNVALIEEHKLTLIGRVTNSKVQKTRALVDFFIHEIPLHYWTEPTLKTIWRDLESVEDFDVDPGRIRVLTG